MDIILETFFPYRLSVLSNLISQGIASTYADSHELRISDWRVLAILGRFPGISAQDICGRGAMDKVTVSRATKRLLKRGMIHRRTSESDRRFSVLTLSKTGREVYEEIAPSAMAYEKQLLEILTADELSGLNQIMSRLMDQSRALATETCRGENESDRDH